MVIGAFGPVTVAKVPAVKVTVPAAAPGPVPALPALSTTPRATPILARFSPPVVLPRVTVKRGAASNVFDRLISLPAHIVRLPSVKVMRAVGFVAFLTRLMLRPPASSTLPLAVVMVAFTLTSRPQHTTRLPRVVLTAALMFTSLTASKVRVVGFVGVHVSGALMLMSPKPVPCAPVLVVVIVMLVPPPACRAVRSSATSTVAELTPEFGVNTPAMKAPLVVPAPIVTSAGSSSHRPAVPLVALALTLMPCTSSQWAEVSTRPPSPPSAPPRALMLPEARVDSLPQSTTVPPLPLLPASALIVELALM